MSATVQITYQEIKDVLVVPETAVFYKNGVSFVRIQKGGSVSEIPVSLGPTGGGKTVVLSGVTEGDYVLLD
jgi:multidrug efflux pump subunit AcrA (membrane-fusion protein)